MEPKLATGRPEQKLNLTENLPENLPGRSYITGLLDNQYLSAGVGLAGLGTGLALFRRSFIGSLNLARKHLFVSLEVPSTDRSYEWVLQWIRTHHNRTQHLGVTTSFTKSEGGNVKTHFDFVPSPGTHWITFEGKLIQIVRTREKQVIDFNTGTPWESVQLTTLGRNYKIFERLLSQAKELALKREEGKTVLYVSAGIEWRQFGHPRPRRPLHSVVLAEGTAEALVHDVREFLKSRQWYIDRGVPYRRGYLLYGPPGCGKSSFIYAMAGDLGYNICILNLNERGLTDDRLNYLLAQAPPQSIILLEDIDAAFGRHRSTIDPRSEYRVTFSGLLNALDGVASTEERLVFMTTNHLELLDPALIRPGRVDIKCLVDKSTVDQMKRMFLRFYPEASPEMAQQFVSRTEGARPSVAELQGFLLWYKNDPLRAIEMAPRLKEQTSNAAQSLGGSGHVNLVPSAPHKDSAVDIFARSLDHAREVTSQVSEKARTFASTLRQTLSEKNRRE